MITPELAEYIRHQKQSGASDEEISNALRTNGWTEEHIQEALGGAVPQPPQQVTSSGGKLPGPIALLKESLKIFRERKGTIIGIALIPFLIILPVIAAVGIFATLGILIAQLGSSGIGTIIIIVIAVLVVLAVAIIGAWAQVALVYAIKDRAERIGFKEAFRRSRKTARSYWWVAILTGFIILGGFVLLIVPGILFVVWFSLSVYVSVGENVKGMDALMKSKEYVRGMWWAVCWRMLCFQIFWALLSIVLSILHLNASVLSTVQSIIGFFLTTLFMIYMMLVYEHLREIKGVAVSVTSKRGWFVFFGWLGITLIPLIILLTVLLLGLNSARAKSRDVVREAEITNLRLGIIMYAVNNGRYPSSLNDLSSAFKDGILPTDPLNNQPYKYTVQPDGQNFSICAETETKGEECLTAISK